MLHRTCNVYRTMLYKTVLVIILSGSALLVRCEGDFQCETDCGTHGTCKGIDVFINGCEPASDPTGNKCEVTKCVCDYGYSGIGCTIEFETCEENITTSPDSTARQCFNGGKCESYLITDPPEMKGEEGTRCNCQSLPTDTIAYAGHQCEFEAEDVCVRDAEHSTYAFCVNGGKCKEYVDFNEEHPLCDCMPGYGGIYCQYEIDAAGNSFELSPIDEIKYENIILNGLNQTSVLKPYSSNSKDELSGGLKFFIVLIVFLICLIGCCICIRKRRQSTMTTTTASTTTTNKSDLTPDEAWDTSTGDEKTTTTKTTTNNEII